MPDYGTPAPWDWQTVIWHLALVILYVLLGLGFFGLAYFLIQKMTPFSLRKEIEEDQNVALGVVLGAVVIGIALIVAAAIRG
jgi:putative membrane protein